MIKGILNGYYRSGTTMLFRIIEQSNPEKIILYEPLNPEIFFSFLRFGKEFKEELHGYKIYNCYSKLPKDHIKKLRRYQLKIKYNYFYFNKEIRDFLDRLDELDREVILQTNRAHFILENIKERYNCPIIHIIRNPIDEWFSFNKPTFIGGKKKNPKKGKGLVSILNILSKIRSLDDLNFVIKSIFLKLSTATGPFSLNIEYKKLVEIFNKDYLVKDNYDKFLCLWANLNKHAINSIDKRVVFWYEDFIKSPKRIFRLKKILNLKIDPKFVMIKEKKLKNKNKENLKEFWIRVKRLGLEKEVNFIFSTNEKIKNMFGFKKI